jgi:asparagine synthetase B (glutamine-hydrolysing)
MLDGEGGDELFGLSPYLLADRIRQGRLLSALQLARRMPSAQRPTTRLIRRRLRVFGLKGAMPPAAHLLMRRLRPGDHYAPAWLAPPLARAWLASEESAFEWKRLPGPLWWSCLAHAVTRGIGSALTYEQSRRRAALAGLESRHPLVDVDVIELVLRFAPELAFDPWLSRPLLRESMAGLLPDEVRLRPAKSSFDQLFHGLLAGGDLPVVRTLLDAGTAELRAFVDLRAVHAELLAGEPPTDRLWRQRWAIRVWRLLTAECWLRMQQDPAFPERLIERTHPPDHEIVSSAVVA